MGRFKRLRGGDLVVVFGSGTGKAFAVVEARGAAADGSEPEALRPMVLPEKFDRLRERLTESGHGSYTYFEVGR
eukprot:810700-Pyramimonas_sp.AAC.1